MRCSQSSPKVNVWMGLSADQIYGPFFFEENINGEAYLNMLRACFIPSLQPRTLSNCIFQQNGAPAHFARPVRQFLDETFPGRWLGRCGPLIWSARSPDLSPLDFFLWGHLKTQVYSKKTETIQQLKDAICEEAANITREMCQNAIHSFPASSGTLLRGQWSKCWTLLINFVRWFIHQLLTSKFMGLNFVKYTFISWNTFSISNMVFR